VYDEDRAHPCFPSVSVRACGSWNRIAIWLKLNTFWSALVIALHHQGRGRGVEFTSSATSANEADKGALASRPRPAGSGCRGRRHGRARARTRLVITAMIASMPASSTADPHHQDSARGELEVGRQETGTGSSPRIRNRQEARSSAATGPPSRYSVEKRADRDRDARHQRELQQCDREPEQGPVHHEHAEPDLARVLGARGELVRQRRVGSARTR